MIAKDVEKELEGSPVFAEVGAVPPGFLNLKISPSFLKDYLSQMAGEPKFGLENPKKAKKIMIDYGGPNVAKPLHVGHLRSAIIGESVKRIARYAGHEVIGDIHLGDWGLQMGLIITELQERNPELVYFDEGFAGGIPKGGAVYDFRAGGNLSYRQCKVERRPSIQGKSYGRYI